MTELKYLNGSCEWSIVTVLLFLTTAMAVADRYCTIFIEPKNFSILSHGAVPRRITFHQLASNKNFYHFNFFHRWRYLFLSNFRFVTNFSQKKFLTTKYDQVDHNTLTHTYFLFTDDKTFTTNNELGWKCQNNKVKFINVCYCIQFL